MIPFNFKMFSIFFSKIQTMFFLCVLEISHIMIWVHLVSLLSSLTSILYYFKSKVLNIPLIYIFWFMPHIYQTLMFQQNIFKISQPKKFTFELMVLKFVCLQPYINFCNKSLKIELNVTMFCSNNGFIIIF